MKIALCSKRFVNRNVEYNIKKILNTAKHLENKVDLICFCESFLQGFDSLTWKWEIDKDIAVDLDSAYIRKIRECAKEHKIGISFGYIEKDNDKLYSSYLVIGKKGNIIENFRRVSIGWKVPNTSKHYQEGDGFSKFKLENIEIAIGLCGDLWYQENVEAIRDLNVDLVLWPVYVDYSIAQWNDVEKDEYALRAKDFAKTVLLVNGICMKKNCARGGSLVIVDGKIVSEMLPGKETVLIYEYI